MKLHLRALLGLAAFSVAGFASFGCGSSAPTSETTGSGQSALGFGTDDLFASLIAPPNLIADADCAQFNIKAGDSLSVAAEETSFEIVRGDGSAVVAIKVPGQGHYVFEGTAPNRIANTVVSHSPQVRASMDSDTTDITIEKGHAAACLLRRCPGFGVCQ